MIIPNIVKIQDDEDVRGWISCLAEVNSVPLKIFKNHYLYHDKVHYQREERNLYLRDLGQICERYKDQGFPSLEEMIIRHTDLPIEALFINENVAAKKISTACNGTKKADNGIHKKPLLYCPVCVQKDIVLHKRIVAHVPHQIDTVTCCYIHRKKLSEDPYPEEPIEDATEEEVERAKLLQQIYRIGPVGDRFALADAVKQVWPNRMVYLESYKQLSTIKKKSVKALMAYIPGSDIQTILAPLTEHKDVFIKTKCESCGEVYFKSSAYNVVVCPFCSDRVGREIMMACGLKGRIINYRSASDIDVDFGKHGITRHASYHKFIRGGISPPDGLFIRRDRVGQKKMMRCGLTAEIIAYRNSADVDVRFGNGAIKKNVKYIAFIRGSLIPGVSSLTQIVDARKHEKKLMNCGLMAEVVRYKDQMDVDVRFENGEIAQNIKYDRFRSGNLRPPSLTPPQGRDRIGETRMMHCGLEATIIRYRGPYDIDIIFSDGRERCGVAYNSFRKGYVAHIARKKTSRKSWINKKEPSICIGEERTMACGLRAKVIAVRTAKDIDIEFENGLIRKNCKYNVFTAGKIFPVRRNDRKGGDNYDHPEHSKNNGR